MIRPSRPQSIAMAILLCVGLTACSTTTGPERVVEEHYVSPKVQGDSQKINLEEVDKAFWDSKGKDLPSWMGAFEKRVNEIYDGKEVVAIDATRKNDKLNVTGYIDKNDKEGFQPEDEMLFTLEQTGDAVNNEMPYRVSGHDGRPYYEAQHGFMSNPFLQAMLISHAFSALSYSTRPSQVVILRDHRDAFRQTPAYTEQKATNDNFMSRARKNSAGGMASTKKFGSGDFSASSGTRSRSWTGSSADPSSSSNSSSGWGRRRSSGPSMFGSSLRRGWGGRRR